MRDPSRISLVLGAIEREWKKRPDLRLGQFLVNALDGDDRSMFGIEDDLLVRRLCAEDGLTEQEREWVESEPAGRSAGFRQSMTFTPEAAARLLRARDVQEPDSPSVSPDFPFGI